MNETIPKNEYDSACNMLETILTQSVEDIKLTDTIPHTDRFVKGISNDFLYFNQFSTKHTLRA